MIFGKITLVIFQNCLIYLFRIITRGIHANYKYCYNLYKFFNNSMLHIGKTAFYMEIHVILHDRPQGC